MNTNRSDSVSSNQVVAVPRWELTSLRVATVLFFLAAAYLGAAFVWEKVQERSACECPAGGVPYLQGGECVCRPPER